MTAEQEAEEEDPCFSQSADQLSHGSIVSAPTRGFAR
jgi:hypothetical protein